jgi:hypothetical protein
VAKLEYRLLDEIQGYPVLYYYDFIKPEEIAARFACDYFVKEGIVYEKTSCAIEPGLNVIYVEIAADETVFSGNPRSSVGMGFIVLELREYRELEIHPLIITIECPNLIELLLYLQSDYITISGVEWEKSSTEIDEERQVYVLYLKKTDS